MNVTNILGSPRENGSSVRIAAMLVEELEKSGAKSRTFELNKLFYRGCQGCLECKKGSEKCVVSDGLTDVLNGVSASEITIISSPVYFGEITGQAKGMVDRCFSFLKDDYRTNKKPGRLSPGKKLVFIFTQGNPDEARFAAFPERYRDIFERFGFGDIQIILGAGLKPDSEEGVRGDMAEKVKSTAKKLIGKG